MLIKQKIGTLKNFDIQDRIIDLLPLEWFETSKRILHKRTKEGKDVSLKFLSENQHLTQDDVLYIDARSVLVVDIIPAETIVIKPGTMYEMAYVCYEIGNKHLPLFFENNTLLIPYDMPVFRMLVAAGLHVEKEYRKLIHQLRTTVTPHGHTGSSLFARILQMTSSNG
jgi:urease accessory protein